MKNLVGLGAIVCALLLVPPALGGTYSLGISGYVHCKNANGAVQPVEGIWIESTAGGSAWASWAAVPNRVQSATYSKTLSWTGTSGTTSVRLHIGCGGSPSNWWSNNRTKYYSAAGAIDLHAVCTPSAGTGTRCTRSGTVRIGMPFSGWFDRSGVSPPATHPPVSASVDWATDLYAEETTAVQARFGGSGIRLTLNAVKDTCIAGKSVLVDVWAYETKVGRVTYGHLNSVPSSIATGAYGKSISLGTTLGYLKKWPYSATCYAVNTNEGVHTHFEAYNYVGYSCWTVNSKTSYPVGTRIGFLGSNKAYKARQHCP
jgi:hypothetical protein